MKHVGLFVFLALAFLSANLNASGIDVGMGVTYIPTAKLDYVHNPNAGYEFVDNILWGPQIIYDFGNGFRAGVISNFYNKQLNFNGFSRADLSLWEAGLCGSYGYEITESGHTLLVAGAEMGYGHLGEKALGLSNSAGAIWIAGLAGVRYIMFRGMSMEFDYRLSRLEFNIANDPERKFKFTGSSLKLSLGYEFSIK